MSYQKIESERVFNFIIDNPNINLGRELIVESVKGIWFLWTIEGINTTDGLISLFCLRSAINADLRTFQNWEKVSFKDGG